MNNFKKFQKVWVQYINGNAPGVIMGLDKNPDYIIVFVLINKIVLKRSIHKDKILPAGRGWKDDYLKTIKISGE